ncbi:hypothetical protein [Azospirillum argentinense]|uniref:hypothetical protein n=1 Tax=Azospirillum argentinense TaxID=2970906 RepID=UPI0032DFA6FE
MSTTSTDALTTLARLFEATRRAKGRGAPRSGQDGRLDITFYADLAPTEGGDHRTVTRIERRTTGSGRAVYRVWAYAEGPDEDGARFDRGCRGYVVARDLEADATIRRLET